MRSLNRWPVFSHNLELPQIRSLALQFVLQNTLESFFQIKLLAKTLENLSKKKEVSEKLSSIEKPLQKLLILSLKSPFNQTRGLFDKIEFYSEILIESSNSKGEEMILSLDELKKALMDAFSKIKIWKKIKPSEEILKKETLFFHSTLKENLSSFFQTLIPFLQKSRSNENVLTLLIENKDSFNAHLGDRYVEKLLSSFFPAGHSQLRAVIHEGYTKRGFTQFLSKVESQIDAIEWDFPCHARVIS